MKRYEYQMILVSSQHIAHTLNEHGKKGWRMVGFYSEETRELKTGFFSSSQYTTFKVLMERELSDSDNSK